MMQLYANAIKFTKPGGVIVVAATAQEATVSITVRDTGIGINPDQCERIFEAFVRVEQVPVRGPRVSGGTGLGLALSRALARRMGGDVTVESTVGAGSTFTVTLPRGMAAPADDPPPRPGVHGGDTSRRPR
jgi:signal transduction histidine kinase